jgi:hypothetical protein
MSMVILTKASHMTKPDVNEPRRFDIFFRILRQGLTM